MNIWLVGGDKVIPTSVEKAIEGDGYTVKRISGEDRYETAAAIAEAGIKLSGKKPSKVFVTSGTSFADALAVSPVAFAKGYPIILTEKDSTSDFSKKELGNIGTDAKILVGGEAVVSKAVAANLSIKEDARVAGADRAVTANLVSDWAKKSEGFNPANAALVGGTNGNGADSLVAASLGGKSFTTLHFAGWDATAVYFKDHAAELTGKGFVFGGKAAVPGDQVDTAQAAAQTTVSLQSIKVGPGDATTLVVADESGKTPTADDRVYTVTGLKDDAKYRVTLVKKSNITVKDGIVTFAATTSSGVSVADAGTLLSDITVVNGIPTGAPGTHVQSVGGIAPSGGGMTFRVDGAADESLVPVVYVDGGKDTKLELSDKGLPTETFGLGGAINFNPAEALVGANVTAQLVTEVDGQAFVAGSSYKYDANDKFTVDSKQATLAQFKAALQAGDSVDVSDYQTDADLVSTFDLTNALPATPTAAAAAGVAETSFTVNAGSIVDGAKVNVYYIESASPATPAFDANTFAAASFTADGDTDVTGFQATIKGLKPGTRYYTYVSQTTELGESAKLAAAVSTDANVAPTVTSIVANDINDSVGTTNQVLVTFSEPVTFADATGLSFTTGGFTVKGVSAKVDNTSGSRWVVTLDRTLNDAPSASDVTYTGKLAAKAVKDSLGTVNVELTGSGLDFDY